MTSKPSRKELTPNLTRAQVVLRDKLGYTIASLYLFSSIAFLFSYPQHFAKWWAYTMIPLAILRIWLFKVYDWMLYFAELCYITNLALFVYIVFLPDSVYLGCMVNTCLSAVLWGVSWWNNSLVFHSLEKYTTWHIHYMAPLAMYTILEFTPTTEYAGIHTKVDALTYFTYGLGGYLFCLLFNYIVIFRIYRQEVLNQEAECLYLLSMKAKSGFDKFLSKFKGESRYFMYYLVTAVYMVPFLLFSYVKYLYPKVILLHLAKQLIFSLWNASKYYMEYMPSKYQLYLDEFDSKN